MFEERLKSFFENVGSLHASNILRDLPHYIPLMKRYPHIAVTEMYKFRSYLTKTPSHNHPSLFQILITIIKEIPELKEQIIKEIGDVLFEYKLLLGEIPASRELDELLKLLNLPLSEQDGYIRSIARSITTLRQPLICIIGAGFSYDSMPITKELQSLLVPLLRKEGVSNPVELIEKHDEDVWNIVKLNLEDFKLRFAGWSAHSSPSEQHFEIADLLKNGYLSHLVSFNWDNLCERAFTKLFYRDSLKKVTIDGYREEEPALWKLHGDVEYVDQNWVMPYESGRVFESLIESLENQLEKNPPAYALVVGYSESEPEVKERLIDWLDKNVPNVLRVRVNWPPKCSGGINDTAKRFFQRLKIYRKLETRS